LSAVADSLGVDLWLLKKFERLYWRSSIRRLSAWSWIAPVSRRFAGANPPGVSAREAYPPRGTMRPGASADKRRITSL
jgi:hypothetical protein